MKTDHTTPVLMSPDHIPQQRVAAVISVPEKPTGLVIRQWYEQPKLLDAPKRSPRNVELICGAEWAWSPMHNRIDNYYLNPRRTGWLLWNNWVEDGGFPWTWHWDLMAHCEKGKFDEKTIAIHLIKALWECEQKHQMLDEYHWINNTGLLSVEEIQAIARKIW